MATIIDLEVTLDKDNLEDSYNNDLSSFAIKRGQKIKYDDDRNELIVILPNKQIRRVKMHKKDIEAFTKYL